MAYTYEIGYFNNIRYDETDFARIRQNERGFEITKFNNNFTMYGGIRNVGGFQINAMGTHTFTITAVNSSNYIYLRFTVATKQADILISNTKLISSASVAYRLLYFIQYDTLGYSFAVIEGDRLEKALYFNVLSADNNGTAIDLSAKPIINGSIRLRIYCAVNTSYSRISGNLNSTYVAGQFYTSECQFRAATAYTVTGQADVLWMGYASSYAVVDCNIRVSSVSLMYKSESLTMNPASLTNANQQSYWVHYGTMPVGTIRDSLKRIELSLATGLNFARNTIFIIEPTI